MQKDNLKIINGREIAENILEALKPSIEELQRRGITPKMVVVLVGDNPASLSYIRQKQKAAEKLGLIVELHPLPTTISYKELLAKLDQLNQSPKIHGIIIQRPIKISGRGGRGPGPDEGRALVNLISPGKDIDGFRDDSKFLPPAGEAVLEILNFISAGQYQISPADSAGKNQKGGSEIKNFQFNFTLDENNSSPLTRILKSSNLLILGRGETGGKPIAKTFDKLGVLYKVAHSQTERVGELTQKADIIISCIGKPNIITSQNLKKGVILIGVGLHRASDGKLKGDYEEEKIKDTAGFYTPTPGGVGPVTVACLLKNLVKATIPSTEQR